MPPSRRLPGAWLDVGHGSRCRLHQSRSPHSLASNSTIHSTKSRSPVVESCSNHRSYWWSDCRWRQTRMNLAHRHREFVSNRHLGYNISVKIYSIYSAASAISNTKIYSFYEPTNLVILSSYKATAEKGSAMSENSPNHSTSDFGFLIKLSLF